MRNAELAIPSGEELLSCVLTIPRPEQEAKILELRIPEASAEFHEGMAGLAKALRGWSLEKPPSISEMLDLAQALRLPAKSKSHQKCGIFSCPC